MEKDLERLIDLAENVDTGVINHLVEEIFTDSDSQKMEELFEIAKKIINRNLGVAQGLECYYHLKNMSVFFPPSSNKSDRDRFYNNVTFMDGTDDQISVSLDREPRKCDYSRIGDLKLEASKLVQGTIGSRGLVWELNDHLFSEEDLKKMNRLTVITKELISYDPAVAVTLQVLHEFLGFGPRADTDRKFFKGNFDAAFAWMKRISELLYRLYFPIDE